MSDLVKKAEQPVLKQHARLDIHQITYGRVLDVDSEKQTMSVELPAEANRKKTGITIANMISSHGIGVRMMPIPGDSYALLLRNGENYTHIGYYLQGVEDFTQNRKGTKTSNILLQRYLESGEVQLLGLTNNEVLLSNDGSVLIKSANNAYLKLEDYTNTLEGNFANTKLEMDGVRVRSGNTRRPIRGYTKEEDYIVLTEADEVKKESEVEDVTSEPYDLMKEFTVQVGTVPGANGVDLDFDQSDLENSSPEVGWFSMATRVVDENGNPVKILGQNVQFLLRTAGGGGFAVTEDNSAYLLDYQGRNFTKFSAGEDSKSLRSGDNNFVSVSTEAIHLQHDSKASLLLKKNEDGEPEATLTGRNGQHIYLGPTGYSANFDGAYHNTVAKEISFSAEKYTFGAAATDNLLKASAFATFFDAHVHTGPTGPPALLLSAVLTTVVALGINVT